MSIATVRVDSRLVHGQVVETWLPALEVSSVVVVDGEAAHSTLSQAAMRMALPPQIDLKVVADGDVDWAALAEGPGHVLVLVRSVQAAVEIDGALDLAAHHIPLNVGVVQHTPGRRPITAGIHLSGDEVDALDELAARGVEIEVRSLPNQPPLGAEDVRARYVKAG